MLKAVIWILGLAREIIIDIFDWRRHIFLRTTDEGQEKAAKFLQLMVNILLILALLSIASHYWSLIEQVPYVIASFFERYLNGWTALLFGVLALALIMAWTVFPGLRDLGDRSLVLFRMIACSPLVLAVAFVIVLHWSHVRGEIVYRNDFNNVHWELYSAKGRLVVFKQGSRFNDLIVMDLSGTALETGDDEGEDAGDRTWKNYRDMVRTVEVRGFTTVAAEAFAYCTNLTEIRLPSQLSDIGAGAFRNCQRLGEIQIPKGVRSIPERAFSNCKSLTGVRFCGEITTIGPSAFQGCESLQKFDAPESVRWIGANAFRGCKTLKSVRLSDIGGIEDGLFRDCFSLSDVTIPENVTEVGAHAFDNCYSLETISFPKGIQAIGAYAFRSCTALKKIALPQRLDELGEYAFYECSDLRAVEMEHCGFLEIRERTFAFCGKLGGVTLPEHLESIGEYAFYECANLDRVTVYRELQAVSQDAFLRERDPSVRFIIKAPSPGKAEADSGTLMELLAAIPGASCVDEADDDPTGRNGGA